ncbi:MAG TPA: hypothetical protein ENK02_06665 [Planctomycetes bacterium]|nr:hypothetical protein [Planctomycetota bacterium]
MDCKTALFRILFFFLFLSPAFAGDWYVSPTGSDANSGKTPLAPFKTFHKAVASSSPFDRLHVLPGTYQEALVLTKPLEVLGAGRGKVRIRIASGPGILVGAEKCKIRSLSVFHSGSNTLANDACVAVGPRRPNLPLFPLPVKGTVLQDLRLEGGAATIGGLNVLDVRIQDCDLGRSLMGVAFGNDSDQVRILRTTIRDMRLGGVVASELPRDDSSTKDDWRIEDCLFFNKVKPTIPNGEAIYGRILRHWLIRGNDISGFPTIAIGFPNYGRTNSSTVPETRDIRILNNYIHDGLGKFPTGNEGLRGAIYCNYGAADLVIAGNVIERVKDASGIVIGSRGKAWHRYPGLRITGNVIRDCRGLRSNSGGLKAEGITFSRQRKDYATLPEDLVLRGNSFAGNEGLDIDNVYWTSSRIDIDARWNDFGGQKPRLGVEVSASVRAIPYLKAPSPFGLVPAWVGAPGLCLGSGDVNGDGRPDLLVGCADKTLRVLRNDGRAGFGAVQSLGLPSVPTRLAVGDLDQDGDPDVCVVYADRTRLSVFKSQAGSLQAWAELSHGRLRANGVQIVSLGTDRYPEILVSLGDSPLQGGGVLLFSRTSAALGGSFVPLQAGAGSLRNPTAMATADLDGDGDLDLCVANAWNGDPIPNVGVLRFRNSGGSLTRFGAILSVPVSKPLFLDLALAPMDGDADPDLLVSAMAAPSVPVKASTLWVYRGGLGMGFAAPKAAGSGSPGPLRILPFGRSRQGKRAGNLAVLDPGAGLLLLGRGWNQSTGSFARFGPAASELEPASFLVLDGDGDNLDEIVTASPKFKSLGILKGRELAWAQQYGSPCGTANRLPPRIFAAGPTPAQRLPWLGNLHFGIGLADARPNAISVLLLTAGPNDFALGSSCDLAVDPSVLLLFPRVTNAGGASLIPSPVPNDPSLLDISVYLQWMVFENGGPIANLLSATGGLMLRVGR